MDETVSLDKKKQKSFNTTVNKYKKLLKKGDIRIQATPTPQKRKDFKERGVIYLGNIPHGFYENQIRDYFVQFGKVTRYRLARSKKTGRSKGYAFIEFQVPEVAKIVAETMNNYIMGKRVLKSQFIPLDKHNGRNFFKGKNYTVDMYPRISHRKKNINSVNALKTDNEIKKKKKKALKSIDNVLQMLKTNGIEYNFKPVDSEEDIAKVEIQNKNTIINSTDSETEDEHEKSNENTPINPPMGLTKKIQKLIQKLKTDSTNSSTKKENLPGVVKQPTKAKTKKPKKIANKKAIQKQITEDAIKVTKTIFPKPGSTKTTNKKATPIKKKSTNDDFLKAKTPNTTNTEKNNSPNSELKTNGSPNIADKETTPKIIKIEINSPKPKIIKSEKNINTPKTDSLNQKRTSISKNQKGETNLAKIKSPRSIKKEKNSNNKTSRSKNRYFSL